MKIPDDEDSIDTSDESPAEVVETMSQFERMAIEERVREGRKQALLVSSEYVGDEFHFRLKQPPSITDQGMPKCTYTVYSLIKMRQENGMWRVYDAMTSIENTMAEGPAGKYKKRFGT